MSGKRSAAYQQNARARRLGIVGSFTADEWIALCEHYGNICLRCGEAKPLTPDHIIPFAEGGTNDISNIQPLCLACNQRKLARMFDYRSEDRQTREHRRKIAQEMIPLAKRMEPYSLTWILHSGDTIRVEARQYFFRIIRPGHPDEQAFSLRELVASIGKEDITSEQINVLAAMQAKFRQVYGRRMEDQQTMML